MAVVGDESEAAESAALLADIAKKVIWISRGIKASPNLVEKVQKRGVEMVTGWPSRIIGESSVKGIETGPGSNL